ncbi:MAG: sulfatase-like hydrolase/transferase [Pseudomonadota bacterium]|nr:sulfatase-like hydrolase/transferase [Pseudomonadota bacterium]
MKLKFFILFFFSNLCYSAPNILLIIGDDMGNETLASYGLSDDTATTATLDQLANEGIRFNNFWTQPVCSPTRATLLTGRYGFRTGLGTPRNSVSISEDRLPLPAWATPSPGRGFIPNPSTGIEEIERLRRVPGLGLSLDEYTLPKAFDDHLNYKTAAIGKWHLGDDKNGGIDHPNLVGFDHAATLPNGGPGNYFSWHKVVNGELIGTVGYAPVDKTNDAINWIAEQEDNPWFLWFALNLPHAPLHFSPEEHWQSDYSHLGRNSVPSYDNPDYFQSMLEAMDTQIGRLLDSLSAEVRANTYVIFMSDNGTDTRMASSPFHSGNTKGYVFQGGINVPLIVTGPGVVNGVSDALVNSTDLFATIMEMAGIDPEEAVPEDVTTDSVSFLPILKDLNAPSQREWVYADRFYGFEGIPFSEYAMRNHRYKLLRDFRATPAENFYDLQADPYEHNNLLEGDLTEEQSENYLALKQQIETLRNSE